eukprot:superscaffoldBa00001817_g12142
MRSHLAFITGLPSWFLISLSSTIAPRLCPEVSRLASGAAVDRYESDRQRHTAVINFLDTTKDRRTEEESRGGVDVTTVEYDQEGEEEYDDEYYYYEYEDGMSGDTEMEMPRARMLREKRVRCVLFLSGLVDHSQEIMSAMVAHLHHS